MPEPQATEAPTATTPNGATLLSTTAAGEAAAAAGITQYTLLTALRAGEIPGAIRRSNRWWIPEPALHEWLATRTGYTIADIRTRYPAIPRDAVRRALRSGDLPAASLPGHKPYRVTAEALEAWARRYYGEDPPTPQAPAKQRHR